VIRKVDDLRVDRYGERFAAAFHAMSVQRSRLTKRAGYFSMVQGGGKAARRRA
jgi:hypothetical protein